jgi:hypothetical protein
MTVTSGDFEVPAAQIDERAFFVCMLAVVASFMAFFAGDRASAILLMLLTHLTVKGIRL